MSRNNSGPQASLQKSLSVAALTGCLASLLFPVFSPRVSFANTPGDFTSGEIESTAPGDPLDPDFESSDLETPPTLEPADIEATDIEPTNTDIPEPISLEDNRFACLAREGQYTVMYQPESRPGEAFPWAVPQALGGGWSAENRCFEIARRLETYRPDGLIELQTGTENGYNVLCATTENNPDCRIVLTVPPNQDPITTRNAVFDNLLVADTGAQTTGVVTYAGGEGDGLTGDLLKIGSRLIGRNRRRTLSSSRGPIRLKPFLDRADGGNSKALNNGIRVRSNTARPNQGGARLNPELFR